MRSFLDLHYPIDVDWAEVHGMRIAYADVGAGDVPIVLVHGLSGYIPMWQKNIGALARNDRVIALDLPGYGKSDKPRASYSMSFFARAVVGLLDALEIPRAILVGHSMGAQISMHVALEAPGRVEALVLSSPAGIETFSASEAAFLRSLVTPAFTYYATESTIRARHEANFFRMPPEAGFMVADRIALRQARKFKAYCHVIKHSVRGMLDEPVHAQLHALHMPTLILFGDADKLIPNPVLHRGTAAELVQAELPRMPNARFVLLPNAGHLAQFEASQAWNDAVSAFVGEQRAPAPASSVGV
ncbi:MAG: alpha/beta fold hydrolase [Nannocystaceae bacterium]|nr:alpha/beta fold hydrolase [bacterium]